MHGNDIEQALPFNVSNQHMNGGVAVDGWNESSLSGCFAVSKSLAHGVTRPGGAALNAGQVGGMRVADQVVAATLPSAPPQRTPSVLPSQQPSALSKLPSPMTTSTS